MMILPYKIKKDILLVRIDCRIREKIMDKYLAGLDIKSLTDEIDVLINEFLKEADDGTS